MIDRLKQWAFRRYFAWLLHKYVAVDPPDFIAAHFRGFAIATLVYRFVSEAVINAAPDKRMNAFHRFLGNPDVVWGVAALGGIEKAIHACRPYGLLPGEDEIEETYDIEVDGFARQGEVIDGTLTGRSILVPVRVPEQHTRTREINIAEYANGARALFGFVLGPRAIRYLEDAEKRG